MGYSHIILKKSNNKTTYKRLQKDVLKMIKVSQTTLWRQFKEQGYFENDDFKVEKIEII